MSSLDLSVSIENDLIDSSVTYLDKILGHVHHDIKDEWNPYSAHAFFRCRLCDSRYSSYSELRRHLKHFDEYNGVCTTAVDPPNSRSCTQADNTLLINCEFAGDFSQTYSKEKLTNYHKSEHNSAAATTDENDNFCWAPSVETKALLYASSDAPPAIDFTTQEFIKKPRKRIKPLKNNGTSKKTCRPIADLTLKPASEVKLESRLISDTSLVSRPLRASKVAISYEEQVVDVVDEESPKITKVGRSQKRESKNTINKEVSKNDATSELRTTEPSNTDAVDPSVSGHPSIQNKTGLNGHENDSSEVKDGIQCAHCGERYPRRSIINHMRQKHTDLRYICNGCFRGFPSIEMNKCHKMKCKKLLNSSRNRSRSRSLVLNRTIEQRAPLICQYCGVEFVASNMGRVFLVKHIKDSHGAKFVCRFCFYNTTNLHIGRLHKCSGPSKSPLVSSAETESKETFSSSDAMHSLKKEEAEVPTTSSKDDAKSSKVAVNSSNTDCSSSECNLRSPLRQIQVDISSVNADSLAGASDASHFTRILTDDGVWQYLDQTRAIFRCPYCPLTVARRKGSKYFIRHVQLKHSNHKVSELEQKSLTSDSQLKSSNNNTAETDNVVHPIKFEFEPITLPKRPSELPINDPTCSKQTTEHTWPSLTPNSSNKRQSSFVDDDVLKEPAVTDPNQIVYITKPSPKDRLVSPQKIEADGKIVIPIMRLRDDRSCANAPSNVPEVDSKLSTKSKSVSKKEKLEVVLRPLTIDTKVEASVSSRRSSTTENRSKAARHSLPNELKTLACASNLNILDNVDCVANGPLSDSSTRRSTLRRPQRHSSALCKEEETSSGHKSANVADVIPCMQPGCNFKGTSTQMMGHLVKKHDENFICHQCFCCFQSNIRLEKHLDAVHAIQVKKLSSNRLKNKTNSRKAGRLPKKT